MFNYEKILQNILRYGLMLAVFIPLVIFRNTFSPFNFGKVIVFRALIEILLVIYIPLAIKFPKLRPRVDKIFIVLSVFTVFAAVSTFLGVNWYKSFWGEWERMGGLFSWLHYYAFFVMVVSIFKKKEDWIGILWLSIFAAFLSAAYGFLQKTSLIHIVGASAERIRILGTLGNPAAFAGYMLFNLFFSFYLFVNSKNIKEKIILSFIAFVFIVAIALTVVRGAIIAFIAGLLFVAFAGLFYKRKFLVIAIIAAAVIVSGALFYLNSDFLDETSFARLGRLSFEDDTIKNRLIVWGIALRGVKEKPIFGWGPENFESVFSLRYDPAIFEGTGSRIFDRAHNIFLDTAVSYGITGLSIFILLWLYAIKGVKNEIKDFQSRFILYGLILAYFIHGFFFFDLSSQFIMLMVLFGLISVYNLKNKITAIPSLEREFNLRKTVFTLLAIGLLSGLLIYYSNVRPALANFYATRGLISLTNSKNLNSSSVIDENFSDSGLSITVSQKYKQNFQSGVDFFDKALKYSAWSRSDVLRKFSEAYTDTAVVLSQKINKEKTWQISNRLSAGLEKDKNKRNSEFSSHIYDYKTQRVSAIYDDSELLTEVLEKQKQAINKFPNVVELYFDISDTYIRLDDVENALKMLEKARELNPSVPESNFNLGQGYLLSGDFDKGMEFIFYAVGNGYNSVEGINWLGKFLEEKKEFPAMIEVFKVLSQTNPAYNIQMSYAYLLNGEKDKAKSAADTAFKLPLSEAQNQIILEIYRRLSK